MAGAEVAHQILRAGAFERSRLWRLLYAEKGYGYTPADVGRYAERLKAWKSLRGRLTREQFRDGKERIIERIRERVREVPVQVVRQFFDLVQIVPSGWSPFDPGQDVQWDWDSWLRQNAPGLDPGVVAQLMKTLADLTDEFLADLERLGRFEIPAPIITITRQGELPAGAVVEEVGRTVSVEINPGAGASMTRVSRGQRGPMVVERVAVLIDVTAAVDVQVNAVPAGVSFPSTAGLADVGGQPLFEATGTDGSQRTFVSMTPFGLLVEMWPRKAVTVAAVAFAFTGRNNSAALRTLVAMVDGRDVRSAAG